MTVCAVFPFCLVPFVFFWVESLVRGLSPLVMYTDFRGHPLTMYFLIDSLAYRFVCRSSDLECLFKRNDLMDAGNLNLTVFNRKCYVTVLPAG